MVYEVGRKPKAKGTEHVAADSGFYYTPEFEGDENLTEKTLGEIEHIAAPHLRKLLSGDVELTAPEKAEFASFIGLCAMRTVIARERANVIAVELIRLRLEKDLRHGADHMLAQYEAKTGNKFEADPKKFAELVVGIANGTIELTQTSKGWSIKQLCSRIDFPSTDTATHIRPASLVLPVK